MEIIFNIVAKVSSSDFLRILIKPSCTKTLSIAMIINKPKQIINILPAFLIEEELEAVEEEIEAVEEEIEAVGNEIIVLFGNQATYNLLMIVGLFMLQASKFALYINTKATTIAIPIRKPMKEKPE